MGFDVGDRPSPNTPLPVRIYGPQASLFGEVLTVKRTPILSLNSSYGTSARRDIETVANGGTIALTNGEIRLRTSATANGSAELRTARRGVYVPAFAAEAGIGIRVPIRPTGTQSARWGLRDPAASEGLYFGQDADGIFAARLTGGTETKYRQSTWNVDKLDGNGPSGFRYDPADGHICQVIFSWYGDGQIIWGVAAREAGPDKQTFIPCHQEKYDGELSVRTPNLPVFAEADNGADASSLDVFVHGRQYSIIGDFIPNNRYTGQDRGSVSTGTTAVPLITFRRKAGFEDRGVTISGYDVSPVTEPVIIEARINGTLTGASFVTPTNYMASETALEADISATAISGGNVVWTELVEAGKNASSSAVAGVDRLELDLPEDYPVTLCARTQSGTGTITSHLRMKEEW